MSDTLSEFEEFLNWKKGKQSQERQEGILTEIRDSLKQLLEGDGSEGDEGGEGGEGEGTPPAPPKKRATGGSGAGSGEGGGTPGKRPSRWFGEATG